MTFFNGSVDFSGLKDERSIGTFEVDYNGNFSNESTNLNCWAGPVYQYVPLKQTFKPNTPITPGIDITTQFQLPEVGGGCSIQSQTRNISGSYFEVGSTTPSGSYDYDNINYQVSWLDKAHTLIADIPKERYLPNGIGEKGYVIIPEQADRRVKDNIDYYLQKAGLIEKTVTAKAPRRGR